MPCTDTFNEVFSRPIRFRSFISSSESQAGSFPTRRLARALSSASSYAYASFCGVAHDGPIDQRLGRSQKGLLNQLVTLQFAYGYDLGPKLTVHLERPGWNPNSRRMSV